MFLAKSILVLLQEGFFESAWVVHLKPSYSKWAFAAQFNETTLTYAFFYYKQYLCLSSCWFANSSLFKFLSTASIFVIKFCSSWELSSRREDDSSLARESLTTEVPRFDTLSLERHARRSQSKFCKTFFLEELMSKPQCNCKNKRQLIDDFFDLTTPQRDKGSLAVVDWDNLIDYRRCF